MSENNLTSVVDQMFNGLNGFISSKTVIGNPVKVDGAVLIPLIDVSCGMAAGSFSELAKGKNHGGMAAKMSPAAILVIQNGMTKLISIKNQDALSKALDMIPDMVNKMTGKSISKEAVSEGERMAAKAKPVIENGGK